MRLEEALIVEEVKWQVPITLMGGLLIFMGLILRLLGFLWPERESWTDTFLPKHERTN